MKKLDKYTDPKNIFLRVALWEEYGYRDVYYGDVLVENQMHQKGKN